MQGRAFLVPPASFCPAGQNRAGVRQPVGLLRIDAGVPGRLFAGASQCRDRIPFIPGFGRFIYSSDADLRQIGRTLEDLG
jgi:hypothetical protein